MDLHRNWKLPAYCHRRVSEVTTATWVLRNMYLLYLAINYIM